jgi:hypothetical protein
MDHDKVERRMIMLIILAVRAHSVMKCDRMTDEVYDLSALIKLKLVIC